MLPVARRLGLVTRTTSAGAAAGQPPPGQQQLLQLSAAAAAAAEPALQVGATVWTGQNGGAEGVYEVVHIH
jgi:hypothetical protein